VAAAVAFVRIDNPAPAIFREPRPLARLRALLLLSTAEVLLGGKPRNYAQKSVSFPGRAAG